MISPSGTALIQSGWNITHGKPFPDKVAEWNGLLLYSPHDSSADVAESVGDDTLIRDFTIHLQQGRTQGILWCLCQIIF